MNEKKLMNNPKNLDLSYKMDLEYWDFFGWKKLCLINGKYSKYATWILQLILCSGCFEVSNVVTCYQSVFFFYFYLYVTFIYS